MFLSCYIASFCKYTANRSLIYQKNWSYRSVRLTEKHRQSSKEKRPHQNLQQTENTTLYVSSFKKCDL